VVYSEAATAAPESSFAWAPEPGRLPIVAVDDAEDAQYFYERALADTPFQWYPARTLLEAERAIAEAQPAAILLDLVLGDEDGWEVLEDMSRRPAWQQVPIIVVSALHERERAMAAGAAAYLGKPLDRRAILDALRQVSAAHAEPIRVLIIDDEEVSRFLVRQCLPTPSFEVLEAATAEEGLRLAADQRPDVVLLDLVLPGMDGRTALQALQATPATSGIPVAIVTATALDSTDRDLLLERARAVMAKSDLSRETLGSLVRTMVHI
jgi:CheY-like chemotaxis protein